MPNPDLLAAACARLCPAAWVEYVQALDRLIARHPDPLLPGGTIAPARVQILGEAINRRAAAFR